MNVGDSVRCAIDDWSAGKLDSAMMHACNAVDGTAKKLLPGIAGNERFTTFLRQNYETLGPMGAPGIDLRQTRFPVKVQRPKAAGGVPDLADVIYGIRRCTHGHGDELPDGFELMQDAAGPARSTTMLIMRGKIRLSDRVIFGLLATAVLSPVNVGQAVPDGHHLIFATHRLEINEWWGRAADFIELVKGEPMPSVKLDFGDWMDVGK